MEGVIFSTHPPCLPEPVKLDKLDILCMAITENQRLELMRMDRAKKKTRKKRQKGRLAKYNE